MQEIGAALRMLRDSKKMSQTKLAARAGLDRSHVSHIEAGSGGVGVDKLLRLLGALGCSLGDLQWVLDHGSPPGEAPAVPEIPEELQDEVLGGLLLRRVDSEISRLAREAMRVSAQHQGPTLVRGVS